MKIKTRLAIAFITITVVPIFLIYGAITALSNYQIRSIQKTYGLSEQVDLLSGNSMQMFNRLTVNSQKKIRDIAMREPDRLEDPEYLAKVNEALEEEYSFLLVRKGRRIISPAIRRGSISPPSFHLMGRIIQICCQAASMWTERSSIC